MHAHFCSPCVSNQELIRGICWMYVTPGAGVDLGRYILGGGSCARAPPALKLELGTLLARITNGAPPGAEGAGVRAFASHAVCLLDPESPPMLSLLQLYRFGASSSVSTGWRWFKDAALQPLLVGCVLAVAVAWFAVWVHGWASAASVPPPGSSSLLHRYASPATPTPSTWRPTYIDVTTVRGAAALRSVLYDGHPGALLCNYGHDGTSAAGSVQSGGRSVEALALFVGAHAELKGQLSFDSVDCAAPTTALPSGASLAKSFGDPLDPPMFIVASHGRPPVPITASSVGGKVADLVSQVRVCVIVCGGLVLFIHLTRQRCLHCS